MRIHHLNCISACPLGGRLMDGRSRGPRGRLACHCLLVELGGELLLVDTGYGLLDVAAPRQRLSRWFHGLMAPDLREELTAVRQVEALGFAATDVRHIVLTHLDFDHAGGLDDFPEARVHMLAAERDAAAAQATWLDRQRFRPQQWASRPRWRVYEAARGEPWLGFDAVRDLEGLPPEVLLVPLVGHTRGHAGVALRDRDRWVLMAGDAYFDQRELDPDRPRCYPGLRAYQWLMDKDGRARRANQRRLRELARDRADVRVMCSHDPADFELLTGRALDTPARVRPVRAGGLPRPRFASN